MNIPRRLAPLVDQGVIDTVVRPLMSGKEAQVYLVEAEGEQRVAKVYKEATERTFRQRGDYTEGRRGRNSRDQRAMARRSRYGRAQAEEAWRNAEVDAIYRLISAGVRVPNVFDYTDGVLVMELIAGADGEPAPRLVDIRLSREDAEEVFELLLGEVKKMLCAGVVHGDLSDFNVLLGTSGPVIIDFPQVVDPAFNRNARKLLVRDVRNLQHFLSRYSHGLRNRQFGEEMWELYEKGQLRPDTPLTGRWRRPRKKANPYALLEEFEELEKEIRERREALGLGPTKREIKRQAEEDAREAEEAQATKAEEEAKEAPRKRRRRRRRRRKPAPRGAKD